MNHWDLARTVTMIVVGIPIALIALWLVYFAVTTIFHAIVNVFSKKK